MNTTIFSNRKHNFPLAIPWLSTRSETTVSDLVRTLYSVPTGSQTMCLWYYVLNGPSAEFWVTQTKPTLHLNVFHRPHTPPTKMRRRASYLCPSLILVINHIRVTNRFKTMCSTRVISYDWQYLTHPDSLIDVIKRNFHATFSC